MAYPSLGGAAIDTPTDYSSKLTIWDVFALGFAEIIIYVSPFFE